MSDKLKITVNGKDYEWEANKVEVVEPPEPVEPPTPTGYRIGTNAHHWMPLSLLEMFDCVRLYVATGWIWRPNGLFVQPFWQAETPNMSGLDDYLTQAKAAGKDVLLCTNQVPDWFNGYTNGSGSNDYPPIKNLISDKSKDRKAASTYQDYADFYFQLVARYGSVKHPDSALRVDTTPKYQNQPLNVKKSGLNLLTRIEIGNELDRWWDVGKESYMEPEEHAALLWACYAACKKADPNIKVIMGGLTGFDLKYLNRMEAYFDLNGVKFMSDAINVHHYSHEGNKPEVWPPTWWNSGACYPEDDKDFPTIAKIVEFSNKHNIPTIVTEFGADSRPESWMHIKGSKYGKSDEIAQGELIVKTFEAYKKAGVKESYLFIAPDEEGYGLWQSCGIFTSQSKGYKPKESFAAVQKYVGKKPAALQAPPVFNDLSKRFTIPGATEQNS